MTTAARIRPIVLDGHSVEAACSTECLAEQWVAIQRLSHGGHIPGRNELPDLFFQTAWTHGFDDQPELFAHALTDAWNSAEFPCRIYSALDWACMFRKAGYTANGTAADRPSRVPALWRAAVQYQRRGLSWTDDRDKAEWFHQRNANFGLRAVLMQADNVLPEDVLGRIHGVTNRDENEWLLDPGGTYKPHVIQRAEVAV